MISKISYSTQVTPFCSSEGERHRKRPLLNAIASMQDSEIVDAGLRNANEKVKDSKAARVLKKEPLMFLAATSMVYGALTKGKLSDKISNTMKAAGATAIVYGLNKPVENAVGRVFNKKENEEEKHPIVKEIVNTAALIGTSMLVLSGVKKGSNQLAQKFKPSIDSLKKVSASVSKTINNSKLGNLAEKASKNFKLFELTNPKVAACAKAAAVLAPIAGTIIAHDALVNHVRKDRDEIAKANINKLVVCRELAKSNND